MRQQLYVFGGGSHQPKPAATVTEPVQKSDSATMHGEAWAAATRVTTTRDEEFLASAGVNPTPALQGHQCKRPGTRRFGFLYRLATGSHTSDRPCTPAFKLEVQGRLPRQQLSSHARSAQSQPHTGLAAVDLKILQRPNPRGLRPPLGNPLWAPRGAPAGQVQGLSLIHI